MKLIDRAARENSTFDRFIENVLSSQQWIDHPNFPQMLEAVFKAKSSHRALAHTLLHKPQMKKYSQYVDQMFAELGQNPSHPDSDLFLNFARNPDWRDHPEFDPTRKAHERRGRYFRG